MPSNNRIDPIRKIMEQVVSAAQAVPYEKDLLTILEDAENASVRKYYLPDEDDRLRSVFATYLRSRFILIEAIDAITPILNSKQIWKNELRTFAVGYTAGCMLVRSTKFIIDSSRKNPTIWKKLDEEEQRYNIERKTLTNLYKNLSSPKRMLQFHQATKFYDASKEEIMELASESDLDQELISLLKSEVPFIESRKRNLFKLRARYRVYDIARRNSSGFKKAMFHIFRLTGNAVADIKRPLKKPKNQTFEKRVTPNILNEIQNSLEPGDIIVTRHDDALSNLFLPGYWPHAAFYMGSPSQLEERNIPSPSVKEHNIIESKKDGVKFRPLSETLYVDHFVILRPTISPSAITSAIQTAISHAGKRYDFLFDFTQANRLACTELIYRAYHGLDDISFSLIERSGRMCIAAEDLLDQSMKSKKFKVHAIFNAGSENILYGQKAQNALKDSYASQW